MGLPCLGQDSLVQMQHNNHLISLDISGDQMTASGRAQILAKPLSFSEHWGATTGSHLISGNIQTNQMIVMLHLH
jgi:hypothetical protein